MTPLSRRLVLLALVAAIAVVPLVPAGRRSPPDGFYWGSYGLLVGVCVFVLVKSCRR